MHVRSRMVRYAALGGLAGAIGFGILGALTSLDALLIVPADFVSPVPAIAAFEGALGGGSFCALAGLIMGLGAWHAVADVDAAEVRRGRAHVRVDARGERIDEIADALTKVGALRVTRSDRPDDATAPE